MNVAGFPPLYVETFFLMFIRVATALFTAPILSNRAVPVVAKVALAGVLTFLLVPVQGGRFAALPVPSTTGLPLPWSELPIMLLIAQEFLVGAIIGYSAQIVFAAIQMGGQLIGIQMGLNIASAVDPVTAGEQVSYVDQFYALIAALLFLSIDGHHWLILGIGRSFEVLPLNSFALTGAFEERLIGLSVEMLVIALRIALPLVAALLLADIGLMVIGRVLPQMNVFLVGLPLKLGMGLVAMVVGLPVAFQIAQTQFTRIPTQIVTLLGAG